MQCGINAREPNIGSSPQYDVFSARSEKKSGKLGENPGKPTFSLPPMPSRMNKYTLVLSCKQILTRNNLYMMYSPGWAPYLSGGHSLVWSVTAVKGYGRVQNILLILSRTTYK